jgi:hypothetical protein
MFGCQTKALQKYTLHLLGALSLYAILLVVSINWLHRDPGEPWKYLIALLPMLPALLMPWAVVRLFREMDELQQKIQLESLAFGFAAAAVLTFTYGFLQNAGLPDLSWVWVWPVMSASWIAGGVVARWRYR